MSHSLLAEIVIIVVAASVIAYLSNRLRQLPIVGFLVAGILIGPHALGIVRDMALIDAVAEIGVILLLFTLGIEFSLERLGKMKRVILLGGGVQVVATILVATLIGRILGFSLRAAIFTAALLALSSTAIVLKVLSARGEQTGEKGRVSIGILIFQDLAVILLVLLIPILGGRGESPVEIALAVGKAAAIIALVILIARRLMPPLLEAVARTCSSEIFILTIIAVCLGVTWLTSLTGVSLSLGAFIAGIVVSESRYSHHALSEIMPLQILFSAAFFVSVGMLLDLGFLMQRPLEIAALVLAIFILKSITTAAGVAMLGLGKSTMFASALLLAQVGEFSFVLARAGSEANLTPGGLGTDGTQYFIAATVVLMMFTPLLAAAGARFERSKYGRPQEARNEPAAPGSEPALPSGHVIIAGYGTAARYLARVLRDSGVPFVVLTLSPEGVSEAQRQRDHVIAGDYAKRMILEQAGIERAKVLVIPDDEPERSVSVASVAKTLNPALRVIVRTRRVSEVEEIFAAGADQVVPEELEGAVELFGRVLNEYEISAQAVERYKSQVRRDHYAAVIEESDAPVVVCDELDEACLNRRTVTILAGSPADGMAAEAIAAPLRVTQVLRAGDRVSDLTGNLRKGDEVTIEGPVERFVAILDLFRTSAGGAEWIELSDEQRRSTVCAHTDEARRFRRPPPVCPECEESGDKWVELRICMTCGHVGCCESSKNRHAQRHARSTEHPIVRTIQPAETWAWCYREETYL